jgi:hypothetical protein
VELRCEGGDDVWVVQLIGVLEPEVETGTGSDRCSRVCDVRDDGDESSNGETVGGEATIKCSSLVRVK